MRIFSLYRDFFAFLEKITPGSSKWKTYLTHYLKPHQEFLENYFSHFPLINVSNLRERVERIKASDYSLQKHLTSACPPEKIINESYKKSRSIVSSKEEPEVYHEYAHFLLNLSSGEIPEDKKLKWLLISEGIGTYFSSLAFPEYKISDHLLMRRDRLNWCQEHEDYSRDIYRSGRFSSEELIDLIKSSIFHLEPGNI